MDAVRFPTGKLPPERLQAILAALPQPDPRVLVGPRLGEDAAVIDMGDRCLVVASDPVTFATERIGWYGVHVNANDVAVMGARPRWFLAVLLLPEAATTPELVEGIMADVGATCSALGVTVCGGHTEITTGLDRPIVIGQMLGEVERDRLVTKSGLRTGDAILLTHGVAIEGTALLAREKRESLRGRLPAAVLGRAEHLLVEPGISVVEAALTAMAAGRVHAMHDPTEGGLLSGLFEMAVGSGQGLRVSADQVPVLPETREICRLFDIDPLRLIASGALLIGAPPADVAAITAALAAADIPATVIAEARSVEEGLVLEGDGRAVPLVPSERDEITKVL